jgi:membrane-bound serine protease (ClpP class)
MTRLVLGLLALARMLSADTVVLTVDGIIQPVTAAYVVRGLERAGAEGADLVVLRLNTPGGLMTSMREIITAMLNCPAPVAVQVWPEGAQAASAGFFILMAADLAVMAPGTNTGAAHPVGGQGEDIGKHMGKKVEEDASAQIRTLAERRGRDVELAEKAVKESLSFTETEALDHGLIDFTASSLADLLAKADGRTVKKGEKDLTLRTKGAPVADRPMGWPQRLLAVLAHPNIAYFLMIFGFLGIYVEITHPGSVAPGVFGALCLLLAFYSLSVLPVNYAGLALILLGIVLLILEVKIISYGTLTIGGLAAFVIGSLMLIDSPAPALRISMTLIVTLTLFAAAVVVFLTTRVIRSHQERVVTGREGLVGEVGEARSDIHASGKVFLHGEWWEARSEEPIPQGSRVAVEAVEGMTLKVRKV